MKDSLTRKERRGMKSTKGRKDIVIQTKADVRRKWRNKYWKSTM